LQFAAGDTNLYGYVGESPLSLTDPSGLDGWDNFSNFVAGAGDSLTFGGTEIIRRLMNDGYDPVNHCSGWYKGGEYTEVAVEITLTFGSVALKAAARDASREVVRREARNLTRDIIRGDQEVLHHSNPLFGHPGGSPALFPAGGLPVTLHSGPLNVKLVNAADHSGIHRTLRVMEDLGSTVVNPATTSGRILRNMFGRGCGCH
jgi:hypothetical protein